VVVAVVVQLLLALLHQEPLVVMVAQDMTLHLFEANPQQQHATAVAVAVAVLLLVQAV
jgi:hypothetical protein